MKQKLATTFPLTQAASSINCPIGISKITFSDNQEVGKKSDFSESGAALGKDCPIGYSKVVFK